MQYRLTRYVIFFSGFALLNSCADNSAPAPVVNAWYQKQGTSDFYIVHKNDTIYSIAFAFGLDYRALAMANHLSSPYAIYRGERLKMTHTPAYVTRQYASLSAHTHTSMPTFHAPTKGPLIQSFSRLQNGHPGLSFTGKLGQPVRAALSGVVVYSGDGVRGYGNLIIIKHNDHYLTAYAFNQTNLVSVGDHVMTGTVIARMGKNDAGRTLLYFEIRQDGVPINPMKLIRLSA